MEWSNQFALQVLPTLIMGFKNTAILTLVGMTIALILGSVVAILRYMRVPCLSRLLDLYVSFVRGTPLLVQAYFAYFALPSVGLTMPALETGIVVLGINYSAYVAEVVRSGIQDVQTGQWEATVALGLPGWYVWKDVILPQVSIIIIPVLGNYLIQMFKDSAVLSAITIIELLATAQQIGAHSFRYLEPLTLAGLIYLIISYSASHGIRYLEKVGSRIIRE